MLVLEDGQLGRFAKVAGCEIEVQLAGDEARVRSTLRFRGDAPVERALFSLIGAPLSVSINGREVPVITTTGATSFCVWALPDILQPSAEVVIESRLVGVFRSLSDGLVWSVQTNDGDSDPHYLDRIAASGFEHDSYPVTLSIHGVPDSHKLFANGAVSSQGDTRRVTFPAWYSPSCHWWVLAPASLARRRATFDVPWKAHDGAEGDTLPAVFLADDPPTIDDAIERARLCVRSLHTRFGPWPHPSVQVYLTTGQNMEYAGATCTTLRNLEHELAHSYFGRCVLPYDGSAGWIDEGVVTWIDTNLPVRGVEDLPESGCGLPEPWRRGGSRAGYYAGASLMGLTERRLEETQRTTDGFLREVLRRYRWRQIRTPEFLDLLEQYAGDWVPEAAARCILAPPRS
ncbi:MAG: hypothetical protein ACJAYU_004079 [Bradymonadia bacterium]|jgi:hypothetical protein